MSQPQLSKDIAPLIANAEKLKSNLDDCIKQGNDREADRLATAYEQSLDICWAYDCETSDCLIKKLVFSQSILSVDDATTAQLQQIFESLINDVELIAKRSSATGI